MDDINRIRHLLRLKEVNRAGEVGGRKESSAEHSWSAMMLAQFFLNTISERLDEPRVLKLLLYHDLVEIEAGDTVVTDESASLDKPERERAAFALLQERIPSELAEEYRSCFEEYEACISREAKFSQAIDKLEPMIHCLDCAELWKRYGFNERFLREKKERFMEPFPEIHRFFGSMLDELRSRGCI